MDLIFALAISQHIGFEKKYNDFHPHFRIQYENVIGGVYYNSLNNISVYGGVRRDFGDFGLETAMVSGYRDNLTPYLRATYKDFYISPAFEEGSEEVGLVIGYEFVLDK